MNYLEIRGLFNRFDYNIEFGNRDIQMLTGPNGFGKSTILRCIRAFSDSNLEFFFMLPFQSIRMGNDITKQEMCIEKQTDKERELTVRAVTHEWHITEGMLKNFRKPQAVSKDLLITDPNDSAVKWLLEYMDGTHGMKNNESSKSAIYEINRLMKDIVGEVFFIEEQRLIQKRQVRKYNKDYTNTGLYYKPEKTREEWESVIELIPGRIKRDLDDAAGEYASKANSLDATYPQRLFSDSDDVFSEEDYRHQRAAMDEKLNKLQKYEISQFNRIEAQYQEKYGKALKIYFEDFNEKYKAYERLIDKLDMFTEMVNKRLYFDELRIDKDKGCVVVNRENGDIALNLDKLSSGEKETIVLFYKLVFEVREGTLLLVDEPEISLHVAWQRMFAEDMAVIARKRGIRILAATHAPMIINGKWDVQTDLGEQYGRKCNG